MRRIWVPRGAVLFGLLSFALAAAQARPARAEGHALSPKQRDEEKKALAAYAAARFDDAINLYAELYAEYRDPIYLRNVGRCYQRMRNPERAIASFEDYLAHATKLTDAERAEINGYITEMKAMQSSGASAPAAASPPPTAPQPGAAPANAPAAGPATPAPAPVAPLPPAIESQPMVPPLPPPAPMPSTSAAAGTADVTASMPPQSQGASTKKKAGIVLTVAGGASLVTGVAFHLLRNSRASDFNNAGCYASGSGPAPGYPFCQGRYDSVQSAQTIAIVGYVGAAVLGGVGAYLLFSDHAEAQSGTTAASNRDGRVRCVPSPDLSLVCGGSF